MAFIYLNQRVNELDCYHALFGKTWRHGSRLYIIFPQQKVGTVFRMKERYILNQCVLSAFQRKICISLKILMNVKLRNLKVQNYRSVLCTNTSISKKDIEFGQLKITGKKFMISSSI